MRSERRHHRERLKKARQGYWGRRRDLNARQQSMVVDTPTPCSCPMCGNPRRYFGELSMQERRAEALARAGDD